MTSELLERRTKPMASSDDQSSGAQPPESPLASYRAVFEAAPDGMLIVDAGGAIRDANPAALEMFAYAADELLGAPIETLVPDELRRRHETHRATYAGDPHPRPMGIGMELRGRRRDGSLFPVEISLSPLQSKAGLHVIATVRDLTLRLRLKRFGAESLRAMEEERHRIALELHDDTAQRLSALLLMLRIAAGVESEEERQEVLEGVREQLLEAAESIRRIARGLRPPALSDAGLTAAIRGHLRDIESTMRATVEVELDTVDHLLSPDERLVVYRVVQEALANVIRHAEASVVGISLHRVGEFVSVTVRDDGRGFDPEAVTDGRGMGLLGMQERAQTVGGTVTVESGQGDGTVVRLDIPVASRRDAHE